MKGLFIVLAAFVAVTQGAPSRSFTAKEYEALQHALGDRIPVAIQSGIRILSAVESNPTDFVVLNFDGLSRGGGGILPRTSVSVSDGEISARTGAAADDDDVAETFSEVAEDAVESVREAAEDAAEAAVVDAISRTAVIEDNSDTATDNTAASAAAEITPETEASTTAAASPTTTAAEATETSAVSRTGLAADAVVEGEDAPAAAAAAAVEDEAAVDATPAQVIAQIESARRKRQNDVQNEYATSLSFALQFLGLELVPVNEY